MRRPRTGPRTDADAGHRGCARAVGLGTAAGRWACRGRCFILVPGALSSGLWSHCGLDADTDSCTQVRLGAVIEGGALVACGSGGLGWRVGGAGRSVQNPCSPLSLGSCPAPCRGPGPHTSPRVPTELTGFCKVRGYGGG